MPISAYPDTLPALGARVFLRDSAQLIGDVWVGAGSLMSPCKMLEHGMLYIESPALAVAVSAAKRAYLRYYLRYSAEHCLRVNDNYLNGAAAALKE
ncbi:MAG: hypothetical protein ABI476_01835 [Oxalobacteraceae bacterium]